MRRVLAHGLALGLALGLVASGWMQAAALSPAPSPSPSPQAVSDGMGRLRADHVRYDTRAQVYVATGNVVLTVGEMEIRSERMRFELAAQVAIFEGGVSARQRDVRLNAPTLRYELRTETAEATGGAILVQKDLTMNAPQMKFDLRGEVTAATGGVEAVVAGTTVAAPSLRHEAKTGEVSAEGGVTLIREGSRLTGRRMRASLVTRRAEVWEDVRLVQAPGQVPGSPAPDRLGAALANEETTVTASRIVFLWEANEAEAEGNVVVRQRDKTAWADRMIYSEPQNRLVLTGQVVLEQQSGEWLVREGLVSPPRDAGERQALASVTRMTCTRLVMSLRERDIIAEGPITVTQKDRSASGDRATYTEATRLLVITGRDVRLQEADGQRLRADKVTISLAEETFEAEGNVQTEFTIRPSPRPRP